MLVHKCPCQYISSVCNDPKITRDSRICKYPLAAWLDHHTILAEACLDKSSHQPEQRNRKHRPTGRWTSCPDRMNLGAEIVINDSHFGKAHDLLVGIHEVRCPLRTFNAPYGTNRSTFKRSDESLWGRIDLYIFCTSSSSLKSKRDFQLQSPSFDTTRSLTPFVD